MASWGNSWFIAAVMVVMLAVITSVTEAGVISEVPLVPNEVPLTHDVHKRSIQNEVPFVEQPGDHDAFLVKQAAHRFLRRRRSTHEKVFPAAAAGETTIIIIK